MTTRLVIVFLAVQAIALQKFVFEPSDQTVIVGRRVTLNCRTANRSGPVQWTKDDFGLGNFSGFDRYSVVGNLKDGDYSFEIYPVELEDDGAYVCQVGAGTDGDTPIISRRAALTVIKPPENPIISQGLYLLVTENQQVDLECVSTGGKPPAELVWLDGKGNLFQDKVVSSIDIGGENTSLKKLTARSVLQLTPKLKHHKSSFTCRAKSDADENYQSVHIWIEVRFAPKISLVITKPNSVIFEGEDVFLTCSVKANPDKVEFRWFVDDKLINGQQKPYYVVTNISKTSHNSTIKCEVRNSVGVSQDFEVLNVTYAPRFRSKQHDVQADFGDVVNITCDVDGNPTPNITWKHEKSDNAVSILPTLTFTVASNSAGRYSCQAKALGFPDILSVVSVYVRGPPKIMSRPTQYGVIGDTVKLECCAFSVPEPNQLIWTYMGKNVLFDSTYNVEGNRLTDGAYTSILTKKNSRQEHFGTYNCKVSNSYGSVEMDITLNATKSISLSYLFNGTIVSIILFVSLWVVASIQRKHKRIRREKMNPLNIVGKLEN